MGDMAWEIIDWDRTFNKSDAARSRRNSGPAIPLPWIPMPTKHDGKGYKKLWRGTLAKGDGSRLTWDPAHVFAAWCLIAEVAGKMPVRGVLYDGATVLTPEDLYYKTECPADHFELALKVLSNKEIGILWLSKTWDTSRYLGIHPTTTEESIGDKRTTTGGRPTSAGNGHHRDDVVVLLEGLGVSLPAAKEAANQYSPERIREVADAALKRKDLDAPAGWVMKALKNKWDLRRSREKLAEEASTLRKLDQAQRQKLRDHQAQVKQFVARLSDKEFKPLLASYLTTLPREQRVTIERHKDPRKLAFVQEALFKIAGAK